MAPEAERVHPNPRYSLTRSRHFQCGTVDAIVVNRMAIGTYREIYHDEELFTYTSIGAFAARRASLRARGERVNAGQLTASEQGVDRGRRTFAGCSCVRTAGTPPTVTRLPLKVAM